MLSAIARKSTSPTPPGDGADARERIAIQVDTAIEMAQ